jgi:hypothetical protein
VWVEALLQAVPAGAHARRRAWRLLGAGALALLAGVACAAITVLALRGRALAVTIPSAPAAWGLTLTGVAWLRAAAGCLRRAAAARRLARLLVPLQARGWVVAHELRIPGGQLDHVAVGPAGVFAVQTCPETAAMGAAWLAARLSTPVTPVRCVPGALPAATGERGVVTVGRGHLAAWLTGLEGEAQPATGMAV